jgi:hypothetical protein
MACCSKSHGAFVVYTLTVSQVHLNKCPSSGGDDTNTNPKLPAYPQSETCPKDDPDVCALYPHMCERTEPYEPDDGPSIPLETPIILDRRSGLVPRADKEVPSNFFNIGGNAVMRRVLIGYPAWEAYLLLRQQFPAGVVQRFVRFLLRDCDGDPMRVEDIPDGWSPRIPPETEHIIDVSLLRRVSKSWADCSEATSIRAMGFCHCQWTSSLWRNSKPSPYRSCYLEEIWTAGSRIRNALRCPSSQSGRTKHWHTVSTSRVSIKCTGLTDWQSSSCLREHLPPGSRS